jgi:NOL1/NOP2/fmu family ribosome biogenesis protein
MSELQEEDTEGWFGVVTEMFGIPTERFEGLRVVRLNTKTVSAVATALDLPRDQLVSAGITLFATKMAVPKLSTAAAMAFGDCATRMVVDASRAEADRYLKRDPFYPSAETASRCDGQGYVVVRFEGTPLGVGFYKTDGVERPVVRSYFPKAWMLGEGDSAFDEEHV